MHKPDGYQIHIQGHLDPQWSDWFEGMTLTQKADGTTTLSGPVKDQAALYGLLDRLRDLGVELISVHPSKERPGTSRFGGGAAGGTQWT